MMVFGYNALMKKRILLGWWCLVVGLITPVVGAQTTGGNTYPSTPDQQVQVSKTCEEFCKMNATDTPHSACLEACTGCLADQAENYPNLGHAVCSGSYGAWVDPINTSAGSWLGAYQSCASGVRQIQVQNPNGSGLMPLPNQTLLPVSDLYRLTEQAGGTWSVEALNPYCLDDQGEPSIDYSVRGTQRLWWERIDGPLTFDSVVKPAVNQPLIAKCSEPMTSAWLSKLTSYSEFVNLCHNEATATTDHKRQVMICPTPGDAQHRNYQVNEQISCSKAVLEVKRNCECQQLGLNAWLKVYENQGSYVTNLQQYYRSLAGLLYYVRKDTDPPTPLQALGTNAPDATHVQKKLETVQLGDFLALNNYKTEYAQPIMKLKAKVHWTGKYTTDANNKSQPVEEEKTIEELLLGAGSGLSWKSAPAQWSSASDDALFKQDYARVRGLILLIAKQNQVEDDEPFRQFLADVEAMMHLVGLKTQSSFKPIVTAIDTQLQRWNDDTIYQAANQPKPKTPKQQDPVDNSFVQVSLDESLGNEWPTGRIDFTAFKAEYDKLDNLQVKLLTPKKADQTPNPEYELFQRLKQRRSDLQKKIGLIDARIGDFRQSQAVSSTTSYPVTQVLRTKYQTERPNGSGGLTVSPGSTESQMVLLEHENNAAFCREMFTKINLEKKQGPPDGPSEFQTYRDKIRKLETTYRQYCKNNFIDKVIYTVSQVLGTAAILLIIIGCYFLVTAQGDDSQISKGKNYLSYAAIGLVISFLSYTAVQFIIDAILW